MIAALAPFGLDGRFPAPTVTPDSPLQDRLAYVMKAEELTTLALDALAQSAPIAEGVTSETTTIAGGHGHDVTLYISRPATHAPRCRASCIFTAGA